MNKIAIIKEADFMETEARALALSLYEEGRFDKAREEIRKSLSTLPDDEIDERLACLNLLAIIERGVKNPYEALRIHLESYALSQLSNCQILRAKFHNGLGITYEELASRGDKSECYGKALIEYEAARFHSEEAGDFEYAGNLENNIAMVLCELGRAEEAHEHLANARTYFDSSVKLAEIDHTEAQVFLKEGKPLEALAFAVDANRIFIQHNEKRLLDEAVRTLIKAAADYQNEKA